MRPSPGEKKRHSLMSATVGWASPPMCMLAKPPRALATDSVSNLPRAVPLARATSAREIRGEPGMNLLHQLIRAANAAQAFHLQIKTSTLILHIALQQHKLGYVPNSPNEKTACAPRFCPSVQSCWHAHCNSLAHHTHVTN